MEELPSDLQSSLASFEKTLSSLEESLTPFFNESLKDQLSHLSPIDAAKLNIVMAYAINTLFYMYLKTQGTDTSDHPVIKELDRVKVYINKVKGLSERQKLKLNSDAASRFIKHALSGNEAQDEEDKENQPKTPAKAESSKPSGSATTGKKKKKKSSADNEEETPKKEEGATKKKAQSEKKHDKGKDNDSSKKRKKPSS
eukprot:TRINITY_DN2936_c0_g1_i2.p1 TRINITY_DN2936_c0_g1~~TRINITY_DN2936_c0_g1_i2.p1  ORF type:complete len:199 (+),score=50.94 TRINITY_DN2936_c0_g1_i2:163-759(+)